MCTEIERAYLARREAEEVARAVASPRPDTAELHRVMASAYRTRRIDLIGTAHLAGAS